MEKIILKQQSRLIIKTSCASQTLPISCINHISSNKIVLILDSDISITVEPCRKSYGGAVFNRMVNGSSPPLALENQQDSGIELATDSRRKAIEANGDGSISSESDIPSPIEKGGDSGDEMDDDSSSKPRSPCEDDQSNSNDDSRPDLESISTCNEDSSDEEKSEANQSSASDAGNSPRVESEPMSPQSEIDQEQSIDCSSVAVGYDSDSMHSSLHDDHLTSNLPPLIADIESGNSSISVKDLNDKDDDGEKSNASENEEAEVSDEQESDEGDPDDDSNKSVSEADDEQDTRSNGGDSDGELDLEDYDDALEEVSDDEDAVSNGEAQENSQAASEKSDEMASEDEVDETLHSVHESGDENDEKSDISDTEEAVVSAEEESNNVLSEVDDEGDNRSSDGDSDGEPVADNNSDDDNASEIENNNNKTPSEESDEMASEDEVDEISNKVNGKRRLDLESSEDENDGIESLHSEKSPGTEGFSQCDSNSYSSQIKKMKRSSQMEEEENEEAEEEEPMVDSQEASMEISSPKEPDSPPQSINEPESFISSKDDDSLIILSSDDEEEAVEVLERCMVLKNVEEQKISTGPIDRAKSRRVLEDLELEKETNKATSTERKRNERVAKQEKKYKELLPLIEKSRKQPSLILDIDLETQKVRVEVETVLVKILKPHQRDGIKFLYNSTIENVDKLKEGDEGSGCILAHCMGLGKTFQIIAFVHTLLSNKFTKNYMRTILIAVPVNTLKNWVEEINKWITDKGLRTFEVHEIVNAKDLKGRVNCLAHWQRVGGVLIIGHTLLANLLYLRSGKKTVAISTIKQIEKYLVDPGPDMVIIDEGHRLKSAATRICQAVERMKSKRKIMLTGTPLQNNLDEYHTMVNIIKPRLLGSKKEFANQFCNPIVNGQKADSNVDDVRLMKQRATVLHKLLSGCIQRFDFETLRSYLKPKFEYALFIRPSKRMAHMYNYYLDHTKSYKLFQDATTLRLCVNHPALYQLSYKRGNNSEPARRVQKRRKLTQTQSSVNYYDDEVGDYDEPILRQDWFKKITKLDDWKDIELSGKFVMLFKILKGCIAVNDKLLVVSQSLETLNLIEKYLNSNERMSSGNSFRNLQWKANKNYFRIDGGTNVEGRLDRINKFNDTKNNEARLFLLSTKAGGIGINLIAANRVIIFDASWNPSDDIQAIFRVYRLGQNKPVYVYRFVTKDTMEEKIFRKQIFKLGMSIRVVDKTQVKRVFTRSELEEFYNARPKDNYKISLPSVPKDSLLADILHANNKEVLECTEFDFLLEKKPEEELSEVERHAAWTEYQKKRDADIQIIDEITNLTEETPVGMPVHVKTEGTLIEEIKENGDGTSTANPENSEITPAASNALESPIEQPQTLVFPPSATNSDEIESPTPRPKESVELEATSIEKINNDEHSENTSADEQENDESSKHPKASRSFDQLQASSLTQDSVDEIPANRKQGTWIEYRRRRVSLLSSDDETEVGTEKKQQNGSSKEIITRLTSREYNKRSDCSLVLGLKEKQVPITLGTKSPVGSIEIDKQTVPTTQHESTFPDGTLNELIDAFQKTQASEVAMETGSKLIETQMDQDKNSSEHQDLSNVSNQSEKNQPCPSDNASITISTRRPSMETQVQKSSSVKSDHVDQPKSFERCHSLENDQHNSKSTALSTSSKVSHPNSPSTSSLTSVSSPRPQQSYSDDECSSAESNKSSTDKQQDQLFDEVSRQKDPSLASPHFTTHISIDETSPKVSTIQTQETAASNEYINRASKGDEVENDSDDDEHEKVTSEWLKEIVEAAIRMTADEEPNNNTTENMDKCHDELIKYRAEQQSTPDEYSSSGMNPDSSGASFMVTEFTSPPKPKSCSSTLIKEQPLLVQKIDEQVQKQSDALEQSGSSPKQTKCDESPSNLSSTTEPSLSPSPTVSMSTSKPGVLWSNPQSESSLSSTLDDPEIAKLIIPLSGENSSIPSSNFEVPADESTMMIIDPETSININDENACIVNEQTIEKPKNWLNVSEVKVKSALVLKALENGLNLSGLETLLVFDCIYDEFGKNRHQINDMAAEENCIKIFTDDRQSCLNIKCELEAFNETKQLDFILSAEIVPQSDPIIQFEFETKIDQLNQSEWINNIKCWNDWNKESEVYWKGSQYINSLRKYKISISVDSKIRDKIERDNGTISLGDCRVNVIDKFNLVLCSTCFEYDHKAFEPICSGIKRCQYCSKRHRGECLYEDDPDEWFCHLCKVEGHSVLSKNCPMLIEKLKNKLESIDHHYTYIFLGSERLC